MIYLFSITIPSRYTKIYNLSHIPMNYKKFISQIIMFSPKYINHLILYDYHVLKVTTSVCSYPPGMPPHCHHHYDGQIPITTYSNQLRLIPLLCGLYHVHFIIFWNASVNWLLHASTTLSYCSKSIPLAKQSKTTRPPLGLSKEFSLQ